MSKARVGNVNFELTDGENLVAVELVKGSSNPIIASTLGYSRANVRYHLGNLYGKLGVATRGAAIALLLAGPLGLTVSTVPAVEPVEVVEVNRPRSTGYSENEIRLAAAKLAKLGLVEAKTVNAVVRDLLEALEGRF